MQHSDSRERRNRSPRPPFRRRKRHPGLAERELPRQPPKPKGELPDEFATSVFGLVNPFCSTLSPRKVTSPRRRSRRRPSPICSKDAT